MRWSKQRTPSDGTAGDGTKIMENTQDPVAAETVQIGSDQAVAPSATCSVSSCHDCGAKPGEMHMDGCDVERCPDCGYQLISCDCDEITHDRIPWDGEWPGAKACREFDLWCRWGPPWIPCDRTHPAATEDLNRLNEVAEWDAAARRWIRKPNAEVRHGAKDADTN